MNRIIIMLAGALLATTAHAQITATDLDLAVDKLTTEVRKVAAAQPKGRRIAMYNQGFDFSTSPNAYGELTLAGTGTAIEGISHTKTGVTVPAGTYAVSVEYYAPGDRARVALHAGTGTPNLPVARERITEINRLEVPDSNKMQRGIFTFDVPTRLYLTNAEGYGLPTVYGSRGTGILLTIEQLDD